MIRDRYGYQTSTRVKLVLVIALTEETVKDNDIKTVRLKLSVVVLTEADARDSPADLQSDTQCIRYVPGKSLHRRNKRAE